jgi:ADP-dependent NAD(P)H-hydrate dehydratase / NAD(P)H-hydrate epimerase
MAKARTSSITQKQVAAFLKPRPQDSNKGMFGTVTVIGGASGMVGAALLAGRAALKMGAGCVHVGILADNAPAVDVMQPELLLHSASDALKLTRPDVLVIGCGLGKSPAAQKLLYDALLIEVPLVLDADALNLIAQRPDLRGMLHTRKAATVFTPHPGEAARLLDCKTEDIQADRAAATTNLGKRLGGSVVLKGAGSLCVTRDGKLYLNLTGNPGMSSAGMGDVLSGMIAAFIGQGLDVDEALLMSVYLHGAAGDELAKQHATLGMSATEVTEWARWLLNRMAPV